MSPHKNANRATNSATAAALAEQTAGAMFRRDAASRLIGLRNDKVVARFRGKSYRIAGEVIAGLEAEGLSRKAYKTQGHARKNDHH